jgi:hypothetical protein
MELKEGDVIQTYSNPRDNGCEEQRFFFFFICAYNVWTISPLYPPIPSPSPPLPCFQAETVLPISLILLKTEYEQL